MKSYHISFFRHGHTKANDNGMYIGTTDFPLSDKGRAELYDKTEHFVYPKVERVYSSPLTRCTETAEILFPDREIVMADEFSELHFGKFEGKTADELMDSQEYHDWLKGGMDAKPPEGESVAELCVRTYRGLHRILMEMMDEDMRHVAIVTHSGVIANAIACFGLPKYDPKQIQCEAGEGFEVLMSAMMWQQSQAFEVLGLTPFLPEESEGF